MREGICQCSLERTESSDEFRPGGYPLDAGQIGHHPVGGVCIGVYFSNCVVILPGTRERENYFQRGLDMLGNDVGALSYCGGRCGQLDNGHADALLLWAIYFDEA